MADSNFQVGEAVEVSFKDQWYQAFVTADNKDGTYMLKYAKAVNQLEHRHEKSEIRKCSADIAEKSVNIMGVEITSKLDIQNDGKGKNPREK